LAEAGPEIEILPVNRIDGEDSNDLIEVFGDPFEVYGHGGNDTILGSESGDTLSGGAGRDVVEGNEGDDVILGGTGRDELDGGAGDDTLSGGSGRDTMTGGEGNDTFEIGNGHDTITDFDSGVTTLEWSENLPEVFADVLDMSKVDGVTSIEDLEIEQVGENTVITYDGGSLTLEGVQAETIGEHSFKFGEVEIVNDFPID
jgi:hypothetical protein